MKEPPEKCNEVIIRRCCGGRVRRFLSKNGGSTSLGPRIDRFGAACAIITAVACFITASAYRSFGQDPGRDLPAAGQVRNVTCESDHARSYTLYLPSSYSPSGRWPILYLFDPAGVGKRPVELYKDIAEKYGFILAGSNDSKNFSSDESKNVSAIWQDTHSRLALDPRRIYTGGFSGGARVAGAMAMSCAQCQIAGVIASGAGYPASRPQAADKVLYFFAVGNEDFNWPEVVNIRRQREESGFPYRVHVFAGPHQWAPAEVMEDAVAWLQLKAMQGGNLPPDAAFIDRQWREAQAEPDDAEKKADAIAQLSALHSLAADFAGLKDAAEFGRRLSLLKNSAALKTALKTEQEQIAEQSALESEIFPKLEAYITGTASDSAGLADSIVQAMRRLDHQGAHAGNETKRLIFRRASDGVWVAAMERGEQELTSGHADRAESCFQLMSQVRSEVWPMLMLADTHAAQGNKKQAVKDLREAVRRGIKNAEIIESDNHLQILKDSPDFQKLVEELHHK
jgi:dienelactone hydrolase